MVARKLPSSTGVSHELSRYINTLVDDINDISGLAVLDGGTSQDITAASDTVIDGGDSTG